MEESQAAWVPGVRKAFETLCAIAMADKERNTTTSAVRAAHIVFEADRHSITTFGRPIYGEHWTAGWMGPIPAVLNGILSGDAMVHAMLVPGDSFVLRSIKKPLPLRLIREPNMDKLSESDIESLAAATAKLAGTTDAEAVRLYSHHELVLKARGGIIRPADMATDQHGRRMIAELEGSMPYIHFGD